MAHKRGKRSGDGGRPRSKSRLPARLSSRQGGSPTGGAGSGRLSEARSRAAERALRRRGAVPVRRSTLIASGLGLFVLGVVAGGIFMIVMARAGWPGLPAERVAWLLGQPAPSAVVAEAPAPRPAPWPEARPEEEVATASAPADAPPKEDFLAQGPAGPESAEDSAAEEIGAPTETEPAAEERPARAEVEPETRSDGEDASPALAAGPEPEPDAETASAPTGEPERPVLAETPAGAPAQEPLGDLAIASRLAEGEPPAPEETGVEAAGASAADGETTAAPSLFAEAEEEASQADQGAAPSGGGLLLSEVLPPLAMQGGPPNKPAVPAEAREIEAAPEPEPEVSVPEVTVVERAREPDYEAAGPLAESAAADPRADAEIYRAGPSEPQSLPMDEPGLAALAEASEAEVIGQEGLLAERLDPAAGTEEPQTPGLAGEITVDVPAASLGGAAPDLRREIAAEIQVAALPPIAPGLPLVEEKAGDKAVLEAPALTDATVLPTPAAYHPEGLPPWEENAITVTPGGRAPMIALVIDDLGLNRPNTRRTIELPAPLTLAFLTYAGDLEAVTASAHRRGHELMVHVPMEPISPHENPGEKPLLTGLPLEILDQRLEWALSRFPGYVGINNHMGSKFTSWPAGMELVMQELRERGLLFLDSVTSDLSVGALTADRFGVPFARRDIFLDNDHDNPRAIAGQLAQLERVAQRNGYAVGIGHPHSATIEVLREWIPAAKARGFRMVPISAVVRHRIEVAAGSDKQG